MVSIAAVLVLLGLVVANGVAAWAVRESLVTRAEQELARIPATVGPGGLPDDLTDALPVGNGQFLNNFVITRLNGADGEQEQQVVGPALQGELGPDLTGITSTIRSGGAVSDDVERVLAVDGSQPGYLVRVLAAPSSSRDSSYIVVARSLNDVADGVLQVARITGAVSVGVLILLVVIGVPVMRRGLRPLRDVETAASDISAGDLKARAPHADEPTEVGSLARTFNTMVDRIEGSLEAQQDSERRLREFLADAGHELRTPLTSVRAYSELIRQGALPAPPETVQAIERIEAEAERMGTLVDELTMLARLDHAPALKRERVDLVALALDVVTDCNADSPDHQVSMADVPSRPAWVDGDPEALRRVLVNLVRNAIVHTPAGTSVEVSISRDHRSSADVDGDWLLHVRDDGPGMEPDVAARVFERFYRPDPGRTRGAAGSGLGLAIVDDIVRLHGGQVSVVTTVGDGADFVVRLPAVPDSI
jgi:two-component system OmpR family sensor kinase